MPHRIASDSLFRRPFHSVRWSGSYPPLFRFGDNIRKMKTGAVGVKFANDGLFNLNRLACNHFSNNPEFLLSQDYNHSGTAALNIRKEQCEEMRLVPLSRLKIKREEKKSGLDFHNKWTWSILFFLSFYTGAGNLSEILKVAPTNGIKCGARCVTALQTRFYPTGIDNW